MGTDPDPSVTERDTVTRSVGRPAGRGERDVIVRGNLRLQLLTYLLTYLLLTSYLLSTYFLLTYYYTNY